MKTTFKIETTITRSLKFLLSLSKHIKPNSKLFNRTLNSKISFNHNSKIFLLFSFFKTRSDDIPDMYYLLLHRPPQLPSCLDS